MIKTAFMEIVFETDKEFPDLSDIVNNLVEVIDISIETID